MAKVLFSIKPYYANLILTGKKHFEYRRSVCKKNVKKMLIYATKPISCIIGEVCIIEVLEMSPQSLWEATHEFSGIRTKNEFMMYFNGKSKAYAYCLKSPILYDYHVPLSVLSISMPPQSFRYISEEDYQKILSYQKEHSMVCHQLI